MFKAFLRNRKVSNKVSSFKNVVPEDLHSFSLQHSMKILLTVVQVFAFFPLSGVTKDYNSLRFRWISFRTVHSFVIIALLFSHLVFLFTNAMGNGNNFFSFVFVLWVLQAIIAMVLFVNAAHNWPKLALEWSEMESTMVSYGPLPKLKLRFLILPIIFGLAGLMDHLVFAYGATSIAISKATGVSDSFKSYFVSLYDEIFDVMEYSLWKGLILELLNLTTTFAWQFSDLMIILLSSALAERFRQISNKIMTSEVLNEAEWREIRKHYNVLYLLCRTLNQTISKLALLSFVGTVYFLSISIYECFTAKTKFQTIYYAIEITFKIFHLSMVCFYASWVHEESIEPLTHVSSVLTKDMSHEVDRLLHQMANRDIGIYGGGLFKITRGAFLNVASVLVTLELIYVQFHTEIVSFIKL